MAAATPTNIVLPGWADVLTARDDIHELRAFLNGRPFRAGCFDDPAALANEVAVLAVYGMEVYLTVNRVTAVFAARGPLNETRRPEPGGSAGDRDIARRGQLFVDIEPDRASGVGTTGGQLAAARTLADLIAADLKGLGWDLLALVCSGNGYHLRYRIDLPADDGGLVKAVLAALAHWYADVVPGVKVDASVFNAARLARVPGALNRKGEGGPETPHRMCELLEANPDAAVVTEPQLRAVADEAPVPKPAPAPPKPAAGLILPGHFNLEKFVANCLPHAVGPEPYDGGRRWTMPCPWKPDLSKRPAFVIQQADGAYAGGCLHDSCRNKTWQDLRALFDGRYAARRAFEQRRQGMPACIANEWRRLGRRT